MISSALFSVLSDIGTPSSLNVQQIADQRHATRFCVGSRAKRSRVDPEVVQHEVSVSLGIVGRVRFRSGVIVETGTAWCVPNAGKPAILFLRAIRRVSLLVFLLVSATIEGKNCYKFKWLWP
jgi:hypothetical protein